MTRLTLRRNPMALLFSSSLWAAAWYLISYMFTGTVLFSVVFCAAVIAIVFSFTIVGLVLLVVAAMVIQACANAERARLRIVDTVPVRGLYRDTTGQTWLARLKTSWTDPALWRDFTYLFLLFGPLFALDLAVLCVWLTLLAGVASPAWYTTVKNTCFGYCPGPSVRGIQFGRFPHGPHGPGAVGFYVDTVPSALALAVICLVVFMLFNYVVITTAKWHAGIARTLLRPPEDPLRAAKEVLRRPGPLNPSIPNDPS
jgi:hypothetical protein